MTSDKRQETRDKGQATSDKKGYRNLIVWQKADNLAYEIYLATKVFPKDEVYGITSQLRRAALSVPTNIAEGFARQGKKEFKQFLNIALGSLTEVEYLLDFSTRLGYLDSMNSEQLQSLRDEVGRLLWGFQKSLSRPLLAPALLLTCLLSLVTCHSVFANNLNISNVSVASQDTSANTLTLQFDISWDNSWSDSTNKDAVWAFVKFSTDSGVVWNHASMNASGVNPTGFSSGSGTSLELKVSADKRGVYIQRASQGSGSVATTSLQLVWNYGVDGVSDEDANNNSTRFKVFGIEMVYVPGSSYYVGDGTNGTNSEIMWDASIPGAISDEVGSMVFATTVGALNAWYYYTDTGGSNDAATAASFVVPATFPKGRESTYVMKYEITQGQYKDFLNTLTRAQQNTRTATDVSTDVITNVYVMTNTSSITNRNIISCPASGNGTTNPITFSTEVSGVDKGDRACNYLSWMDLCAYLDWAALRPMTELEYENFGRGPLYPVAGEYAWGSTSLTAAATIVGTENGTETISTASANANYNGTTFTGGDGSTGPLRVGIFATTSNDTRVLTGAGYYGIMELTGNVWERAVSIGVTAGRGYEGTHGDGVLTSVASYEGNATNYDWPGLDATSNARGITGATGSGLRGGGWATTAATMVARAKLSARYFAGTTDTTRGTDYGGRGVRTPTS